MIEGEDGRRFSRLSGGALVFCWGLFFLLLSLNGLSDRGFWQFVDAISAAIAAALFPSWFAPFFDIVTAIRLASCC